jgi:hypothetical protein
MGCVLLCGCEGDGGNGGDNTSTPVDVSGTWTLISIPAMIEYVDGTMTLSQSGNAVSGSFQDISRNYGTIDGTISGNSITFNHVYTSYAINGQRWLYWGTVDGDVMRGKYRRANSPEGINEVRWKATRQN